MTASLTHEDDAGAAVNSPGTWRDTIEVHHAADLFPMMSRSELEDSRPISRRTASASV